MSLRHEGKPRGDATPSARSAGAEVFVGPSSRDRDLLKATLRAD